MKPATVLLGLAAVVTATELQAPNTQTNAVARDVNNNPSGTAASASEEYRDVLEKRKKLKIPDKVTDKVTDILKNDKNKNKPEDKPADNKPADNKPADNKPADNKPVDKSVPDKSEGDKSGDKKSGDGSSVKVGDNVGKKLGDIKPGGKSGDKSGDKSGASKLPSLKAGALVVGLGGVGVVAAFL